MRLRTIMEKYASKYAIRKINDGLLIGNYCNTEYEGY